jgi:hypothetical protein
MISGNDLQALFVHLAGGFDDGARLHLGNLGICNPEADASMAEHRVELVKLFDTSEQRPLLVELLSRLAEGFQPRDVDHQLFALRQEFVERRIDGADRDRLAVHALEDAVEVLTLQRQQLRQRPSAVGFTCRENHALHDRDAPFAEEHVLGSAQPDALGAERMCEFGLIRLIRVRAYPEPAELVGPGQQLLEPSIETRLAGVEAAVDDLRISLGFVATCAIFTSPLRPSNEM